MDRFPGASEFDWQSSMRVGATAPLTGCSMPLECILTDRSPALDAPPSTSHLEMALLWSSTSVFVVIWLRMITRSLYEILFSLEFVLDLVWSPRERSGGHVLGSD